MRSAPSPAQVSAVLRCIFELFRPQRSNRQHPAGWHTDVVVTFAIRAVLVMCRGPNHLLIFTVRAPGIWKGKTRDKIM